MSGFKNADIITIEIGSQLFLASPVLTFYLDKIIRRHAMAFKSCLGVLFERFASTCSRGTEKPHVVCFVNTGLPYKLSSHGLKVKGILINFFEGSKVFFLI